MDDEEEDMSTRPISQSWGTPFRDVKYEDPTTQVAAGQALPAPAVPATQSHNNISISNNLHQPPRVPFHGKERGRDNVSLPKNRRHRSAASQISHLVDYRSGKVPVITTCQSGPAQTGSRRPQTQTAQHEFPSSIILIFY